MNKNKANDSVLREKVLNNKAYASKECFAVLLKKFYRKQLNMDMLNRGNKFTS